MPTEAIKTVMPGGGGDYLSLNAFDAAERRDLVAADEIAVAECHPGGNLVSPSTSQLLVGAGWTVDATHYIEYRNAPGFHALGAPFSTAIPRADWNIVGTPTTGLEIDLDFFRLKGLQLRSTGNQGRVFLIQRDAPNADIRLEESLFVSFGTDPAVTDQVPFAVMVRPDVLTSGVCGGTNGNGRFLNNVVFFDTPPGLVEGAGVGFFQQGDLSGWDTANNTFIIPTTTSGASFCFVKQQTGTLTSQNNYFKVTGTATVYFGVTSGTKDMTSNAEAVTPANRNIAYDISNFVNPTTINTTFDVDTPIGSALIEQGANTGSLGVLLDTRGVPRSLPYDIGAYEGPGGTKHFIAIKKLLQRGRRG